MKEVNEKCLKEIYLNVLKAILVIFCFLMFNIACQNIREVLFNKGIQIATMIFLFISIFIFEKAYKEDNGKRAIDGIEVLVLAIYILTVKYISNKFGFQIKTYLIVAGYIFAIYFILKSIIIYTQGRRQMERELSDIKEIVKKEEPLKKVASKKKKEVIREEKSNEEDNKPSKEEKENKIENKRKKEGTNNKKTDKNKGTKSGQKERKTKENKEKK